MPMLFAVGGRDVAVMLSSPEATKTDLLTDKGWYRLVVIKSPLVDTNAREMNVIEVG